MEQINSLYRDLNFISGGDSVVTYRFIKYNRANTTALLILNLSGITSVILVECL